MPVLYDETGKPAYIYSSESDTWYLISGVVNTAASYEWQSNHTFLSTVTIVDHLVGKKGINNFLNPAARDAAITSPTSGIICLIRQNSSGTTVNEIQYYDGSSWRSLIPSQTGKDGKYLKTNGTITSWDDVPETLTAALMLMGG
jgi:hypothetical protein